jgi:zinc transport system substrate-binding protein
MSFTFAGCDPREDGDKIDITAVTFPCYDFARAVAKDRADIAMLIRPGAEIHSYDPSPQDIAAIAKSDVFIYIGGESDAWVDRIIDAIDADKVKIVRLIDYVEAVEEEIVEGMEEEEAGDGGEEEAEYDEHIWTSPTNAIIMIDALCGVLSELDGGNAEFYAENAESYTGEIAAVRDEIADVVAAASVKKIVVADRFPFRYFADEFGLEYSAAFPGCSDEADASPATIQYLINAVKNENIACVYYVELSNQGIANIIKEETGCQTALLHSCERPTADEFNSGATYVTFMKNNVQALKKGVK